jgi:hypothetical protein
LAEDASGVGSTTIDNIRGHFEEGDDFLDAAEDAYQDSEMSALEAVDGVGTARAKTIALTIADAESWEGGALFSL